MQLYLLLNTETKAIIAMNIQMILDEINRDLSNDWTELKIIRKIDGC